MGADEVQTKRKLCTQINANLNLQVHTGQFLQLKNTAVQSCTVHIRLQTICRDTNDKVIY